MKHTYALSSHHFFLTYNTEITQTSMTELNYELR